MTAFDVALEIISRKGDQWDEPGDAWILRPDPDIAYLNCEALADAIGNALLEAGLLK